MPVVGVLEATEEIGEEVKAAAANDLQWWWWPAATHKSQQSKEADGADRRTDRREGRMKE